MKTRTATGGVWSARHMPPKYFYRWSKEDINMERMSVRELKRYFEGHRPQRILFATEDQPEYKVENPVKAWLCFHSLSIAYNPDVICLRSGESVVNIEFIKYAILDPDSFPGGVVLTVVCGTRNTASEYTLVVM